MSATFAERYMVSDEHAALVELLTYIGEVQLKDRCPQSPIPFYYRRRGR